MWAEFPVRSEQKSSRLRTALAGQVRPRGRGALVWLLVPAVMLGAGLFGPPTAVPDHAESTTSGANHEERRLARFQPGGMTLSPAAAGPAVVATNERLSVADGCLAAGQIDTTTSERAGLSRLFETLGRSPTGAALLRAAAARGARVCVDRATDLLAYYFANMNVVGVRWDLSEGGRVVFLAHELAHIPQHPRYSDNRYFPPVGLVLLRRMREAVAEAIATRFAWELRQAGFAAAWDEKLATPYADVARAFAQAIEDHPGVHAMAVATRAAFDQWFAAPWRRDVYDRMTVAHLRRIATDALGLVPAQRQVTDQFLVPIGRLGRENFLANSTSRPLTDAYYAGHLSAQNARHIEHLGHQSGASRRSVAEGPLADVAS